MKMTLICKLGLAAVLVSAANATAQVPDPTPAINAARNAKAQTEAAQKKNSDALDPPAR